VAYCDIATLVFNIMRFLKLFRRGRSKSTKGPPTKQQSPPKQSQSKLLTIPGEIRNQIYRHVIVSDSKIRITNTPIPEPALLKTCSTIRRETIAIYYLENSFDIDCPNWRHSVYQEFYKIYRRHVTAAEQARVDNVFWINTGAWTCKANLLEFL
jgi:hypothetical protein